ncbi:MAG: copper-binding protein [Burkholderiaceae bacterium]
MTTIHTAAALISAAFLGTACAATGDGHAHDHASSTSKTMSHDMKAGQSAAQKSMAPMQAKDDKMMMAAGSAAMTQGEIKRINKGSKKITIKHGPITNLDMPPMTMVFRVADDAMLDAVKKGDSVMFHVEDKDGAMVITEIKPAK